MNAFLVSAVLSLTVTAGVGLGVTAAYGAVVGILHAFAAQSRREENTSAVLVPSESHASGD